jgi:ubiquinone/menaquinone biosynthesis C-methylase UbiE
MDTWRRNTVTQKPQISRVTRSKAQAKAAYDKLSRWYDWIVGRSEKRHREAGLQKLDAREGERVLEIGFGTGQCILALAQSVGETGKVYGLDISEGMLKIAQERIEKAGLSQRVDLRLGDATKLPFEADSMDAVFASFVLELFDTPEIPIVLEECKRVLRTGGRICVVAMSKEEKPSLAEKLYEWMHEKFPNYVDCRPIFVQESLESAGFAIADSAKLSTWGLSGRIVLARKESHA